MRCALIKDGVVVNMIVADPATDKVEEGFFLIGNLPEGVDLGTPWDGEKFEIPPANLPRLSKPRIVDGMEML